MIENLFSNAEIGSIELVGEKSNDITMWSLNRYLQEFCNNYYKILTIKKICILFQNGASDSQFIVAKQSAQVFSADLSKNHIKYRKNNYIVLNGKEEDPKMFWQSIVRKSRPVVFYKYNDNFIPLINLKSADSIKITSLQYNSPPIIDAQGALDGLIDLAFAGTRNQRDEETFIASQIGVLADNYGRIASASKVVNNPGTPEGVKLYANNGLQSLLEQQSILNKKLGIRVASIDRRC